MSDGINVLSLFDGISCGMIALERAGIKVNKYYASEIDKFAIQVSKDNYPDIIQLGDVTKWKEWNIDWASIDLLIGGSPCQGFSLAGKKLNFEDSRSKLFFEYVNILNCIRDINPGIKFLLENVKMKREWEEVISGFLGVSPIMINSALVSAQNRKRNYWANWNFCQPNDKNIVLKDILEHEVNDGWRLHGGASRGRYDQEKKVKQQIEDNGTSKSNCLTTVEKDTLLLVRGNTPVEFREIHGAGQSIGKRMEKSYTLLARDCKGLPRYECAMTVVVLGNEQNDHVFIRQFTPVERERLQTLPDNYTAICSKTQRLKQTGNCWTADVIAHIFNHLKPLLCGN